MNDAMSRVKNIASQDENIEKIFKKYFELDTDKHKDNPGYMAWALSALTAAMGVTNVLLAVRHPDSGRGFRAIQDLTYQLGANDFWSKNSPVLVPILTTALNAHKDYIAMRVEAGTEYAVYDKLMSGAQAMPLEIFSMILYLVGGPMLMATSSLPLKTELAPYFLG